MRLIDADEVQKRIDLIGTVNGILCWDAHDFIDHVPTIEAEPLRHGKWIADPNIESVKIRVCSECEAAYEMISDFRGCIYPHNYCPYCGARMDGGAGNG